MLRRTLVLALCFTTLGARAQPAAPAPAAPPAPRVRMADDGQLFLGDPGKPVAAVEVFRALGRADLVERSEVNARRRLLLGVSAAFVTAIGIGTGIVLFSTGYQLTSPFCQRDVTTYNEVCRPDQTAHQVGGTAAIAAGVVAGGILASLAYWSRPEVFSKFELRTFIDGLGAHTSLQLSPTVSPGFSGLLASGTF